MVSRRRSWPRRASQTGTLVPTHAAPNPEIHVTGQAPGAFGGPYEGRRVVKQRRRLVCQWLLPRLEVGQCADVEVVVAVGDVHSRPTR